MESRFHSPYRRFFSGVVYLLISVSVIITLLSVFAYLLSMIVSS